MAGIVNFRESVELLAGFQFREWGQNHTVDAEHPGNPRLLAVETVANGRRLKVIDKTDVSFGNRFKSIFGKGPLAHIDYKLKHLDNYFRSLTDEELIALSENAGAQKNAFEVAYRIIVHRKDVRFYSELGKVNDCRRDHGKKHYYIPVTGIYVVVLRALFILQQNVKIYRGPGRCWGNREDKRSLRKRDIAVRKKHLNNEEHVTTKCKNKQYKGNVNHKGMANNKLFKLEKNEVFGSRLEIKVEGFDSLGDIDY